MQSDQWVTAAASLVGAIIGAGAALTTQYLQLRRTRRTESDHERKLAIVEVLVRAQAVDLRAQNMALLASNAGSFYGLVARVLNSAAPLNYADMAERLSSDADALSRAAAQVWLFGDDQAVRLTNAVVLAAADVVTAHNAQTGRRLTAVLKVAVIGQPPYDEERIARARQALAKTRRALTDHTRQALKLEPVDVFGLPVAPRPDAGLGPGASPGS